MRERLRLEPGARVTELQRVRFVNREPISLDISYVPVLLGERLAREDLATRDLFAILENDCGLALGHADLQIGAMLADSALAGHLGVAAGSPILFIERLTYALDDKGETPIDFELLHYRADAFSYRVRVDRTPVSTSARPG